MAFDARKLRVIHLRPGILEQLFREGHVCTAGRTMLPIAPVPEDLTIVCSSFDHVRHLITLVVYSNSFAPVPKGVEPPAWELAFSTAGPAADAASTNTEGGQG